MTLELNCAPFVGGVEINTSKCGPLNWEHLCPSAPQLQGLVRVNLEQFSISSTGTDSLFGLLFFAEALIDEHIYAPMPLVFI